MSWLTGLGIVRAGAGVVNPPHPVRNKASAALAAQIHIITEEGNDRLITMFMALLEKLARLA